MSTSATDPSFRIAIFHDNFAQMGGAERVTEALHRALPSADLMTTLSLTKRLTPYLQAQKPRTTWMQWLPMKQRFFRHYFMLYPLAVEMVDLNRYDLIVTSCFGYAKGVRRRKKGSLHVCYCHNPMRWVWRTQDYLEREDIGGLKLRVLKLLLSILKSWELRAAGSPDNYIANSNVVAQRLKQAFNVDAPVIFPPIETSRFSISPELDDNYLVLARLAPYKRVELAVEACTRLGRKLIVIGDGPDRKRLEGLAGPTVTFAGRKSDAEVSWMVSRCKALLFPGEEDFGITPLEVNAAGRPVIAFRGGGVLETIQDGTTGLFFNEPTVESMMEAIERSEMMTWNPEQIRSHALSFDTKVFQQKILDFLNRVTAGSVKSFV